MLPVSDGLTKTNADMLSSGRGVSPQLTLIQIPQAAASKLGGFLELRKNRREKLVPFFDDIQEATWHFREPRPL